jgi:hypothetical protein
MTFEHYVCSLEVRSFSNTFRLTERRAFFTIKLMALTTRHTSNLGPAVTLGTTPAHGIGLTEKAWTVEELINRVTGV